MGKMGRTHILLVDTARNIVEISTKYLRNRSLEYYRTINLLGYAL